MGYAHHVSNLITDDHVLITWRYSSTVFGFMFQPICLWGKWNWCPLSRRLSGNQSRYECCEEGIISCSCEKSKSGLPSRSPSLYRLICSNSIYALVKQSVIQEQNLPCCLTACQSVAIRNFTTIFHKMLFIFLNSSRISRLSLSK
jgi:hypothetical protein